MKKLKTLLLLLIPTFCLAQDSNLGNWLIYIGSKKINSKWNLHHEIQHRNYNAIGDLEQLLVRTGIGYNLTEGNNNFLLGYAYILSENYINEEDKFSVNEHRIFQQFITKHKIGRVGVQHRYRFEQRFIDTRDDMKLRLRYFLAISVPLGTPQAPTPFYLSAYNEIFMDTQKETAFDRNRLYGGIGYRLNTKLRFELGYMNQFLASSNRDQVNVFVFANF